MSRLCRHRVKNTSVSEPGGVLSDRCFDPLDLNGAIDEAYGDDESAPDPVMMVSTHRGRPT